MISINLKKIVEDKGISMTEVHEGTGISKNTLSTMANGLSKGIQFDTLDKLLEYLAVEVGELILFTSKKEIETLKIGVHDQGVVQVTKDKILDNILSPSPPKKPNESQAEYESRLVKTKHYTIGKETRLYVKKRFEITIRYDDYFYSFYYLVDYVAVGIKDKRNVVDEFYKYDEAAKLDFDEETSSHQALFILPAKIEETDQLASSSLKVLNKHFNRLGFTVNQREVAYNKIEKEIIDAIPQETKDFIEENDIRFKEIDIHLS